jgi:hypothetical protein
MGFEFVQSRFIHFIGTQVPPNLDIVGIQKWARNSRASAVSVSLSGRRFTDRRSSALDAARECPFQAGLMFRSAFRESMPKEPNDDPAESRNRG